MTHTDILLSGAFAAFTVDLLVYPLDTIKTRLQSPAHRHLPLFGGLYQGLGPVILATLPSSAVFFTTYEFVRSHLPPDRVASNMLASSVAEIAACAVVTPAEVVKQNAQVVQKGAGAGAGAGKGVGKEVGAVLQAFRGIRRTRDLWTGYVALVARNLPYVALQFPAFEWLKARWCPKDAGGLETAVWSGVAAGSAGVGAAWVTTPVDVVKTRIMLAAGEAGGGTKIRGVVADILREEGVRGLWRGAGIRAAWTMLGSGLYLGVYEGSKVWLEERRRGKEEQVRI
ncbi:mitochondrial carrier protein-like protein [Tricharina praecox]|uniref:mitochondrial carrier protein-like protein n=1 Tax=Tricharina praecox TaxID=43433 RepID=UPI00221E77B3|nr:mitochondrial carrier protein-like protein [Tricharina praecox]KAI5843234.1 mitochondrial carrier protein-like protein [Tricharina praecox]